VLLSILIATYNRRDLLERSLEALGAQSQAPSDFEVVVMVDGSTDGTLEMLRDHDAPYRLVFERQDNQGKAVAINRAAMLASGRYCLMLDDDIGFGPEIVAEHLRIQEEHSGVIAAGPMSLELPPGADGFTEWYRRNVWDAHYGRLLDAAEITFRSCYGGNISFPRQAFLDVGGFSTELSRGFDTDLAYRLSEHGLGVVLARQATAAQHLTKGFRELAWDAERSGAGRVALYRKHPETFPHLGLSRFREITPKAFVLRELMLRTHVHPRLLARADAVIRRLPGADHVYATIYSYCLWRGVRRALGGDEQWRALRRGEAPDCARRSDAGDAAGSERLSLR
jgi:glycosyltransferase involved in cell wall biosynthesis